MKKRRALLPLLPILLFGCNKDKFDISDTDIAKHDKKMEESQKATSAEGAMFLQKLSPDEKQKLFEGRIEVDKNGVLVKPQDGLEKTIQK